MEERIPALKSSIESLSERLDQVFFKDATPTSIRSTVSAKNSRHVSRLVDVPSKNIKSASSHKHKENITRLSRSNVVPSKALKHLKPASSVKNKESSTQLSKPDDVPSKVLKSAKPTGFAGLSSSDETASPAELKEKLANRSAMVDHDHKSEQALTKYQTNVSSFSDIFDKETSLAQKQTGSQKLSSSNKTGSVKQSNTGLENLHLDGSFLEHARDPGKGCNSTMDSKNPEESGMVVHTPVQSCHSQLLRKKEHFQEGAFKHVYKQNDGLSKDCRDLKSNTFAASNYRFEQTRFEKSSVFMPAVRSDTLQHYRVGYDLSCEGANKSVYSKRKNHETMVDPGPEQAVCSPKLNSCTRTEQVACRPELDSLVRDSNLGLPAALRSLPDSDAQNSSVNIGSKGHKHDADIGSLRSAFCFECGAVCICGKTVVSSVPNASVLDSPILESAIVDTPTVDSPFLDARSVESPIAESLIVESSSVNSATATYLTNTSELNSRNSSTLSSQNMQESLKDNGIHEVKSKQLESLLIPQSLEPSDHAKSFLDVNRSMKSSERPAKSSSSSLPAKSRFHQFSKCNEHNTSLCSDTNEVPDSGVSSDLSQQSISGNQSQCSDVNQLVDTGEDTCISSSEFDHLLLTEALPPEKMQYKTMVNGQDTDGIITITSVNDGALEVCGLNESWNDYQHENKIPQVTRHTPLAKLKLLEAAAASPKRVRFNLSGEPGELILYPKVLKYWDT